MDNYDRFKKKAKEAADFLKEIDKKKPIRVISHIDCDGICSAAILIKALTQDNRMYSLTNVQQLNRKVLEELSKENFDVFIFTDLGSGLIKSIAEFFKGKKVIILDHHELESKEEFPGMMHVNPHLFSIDGSKEISGSGVVYYFASFVHPHCAKFAHIAVIGAIGDIQEDNGFQKLNNDILLNAVKQGTIQVRRGFRFFGLQTRPLYKVLEYSSDPYIPDVSGSESGAIQFMHQLGISPKKAGDWRKITDLNEEEQKRLAAGIIMKRHAEERPDDIFGNIYILPHEEDQLKDVKEFSTLLNACGRLNKSSLGIGTCLNNKAIKKKALEHLQKYKRELIKAMNWYRDRKSSKDILQKKGYMIINARDSIPSTIIGTLASIISKSNEFKEKTYIMAIAQNDDDTSKVSLRIAGNHYNKEDVDLRQIVSRIVDKVGGESGGHMQAAGAIIKSAKEDEFIANAVKILERAVMEEFVY